MNKLFCILLLGIMIFPLVSASDIAYITRGMNYVDENVVNAINELINQF